jgi:hypothetical protein
MRERGIPSGSLYADPPTLEHGYLISDHENVDPKTSAARRPPAHADLANAVCPAERTSPALCAPLTSVPAES